MQPNAKCDRSWPRPAEEASEVTGETPGGESQRDDVGGSRRMDPGDDFRTHPFTPRASVRWRPSPGSAGSWPTD